MSSLTVTFTGTSSVLRADFLPEIKLDPDSNYCCGLLDFTSYNSIPNITEHINHEFRFEYSSTEKKKDANGKDTNTPISVVKKKTISFPTGSYEVEDILKYLKAQLAFEKIIVTYDLSVATSKVRISFSSQITWTGGSVLNVIGFHIKDKKQIFERGVNYWSDSIVRITEIDVIRIECDIVSDSYINGRDSHTIHQFSHCKVSPGHKFIEVPQHIIYLPIKQKRLASIQISVVDQNGTPINFRGEQISCRIHIKKVNNFEIA